VAPTTTAPRVQDPVAVRRAELREALERALEAVDADDRVGPLIGATQLRMRFEFTDLDLALNLAAGDRDRNIEWSFADDPGWKPRLVLRMSSAVANRYLLGRESLAIALARREVRCEADSRVALLYLPAARLVADSYRKVVERDFPSLAAA
jgi:hypothetical protein